MEQTINLNAAECIKSVSNIGHTQFVNICSGATQNVPWGSLDWIAAGFCALIVLAMIGCVGLAIYALCDA